MIKWGYFFINEVRIDKAEFKSTCDFIEKCISLKKLSHIISINVDVLLKATKDLEFKIIINNSELVLVDSRILFFSSYLLGKPLEENVVGSDFVTRFSEWASKKGYTLFFLGAAPGVAVKAAEILIQNNSGLKIVGAYSPPFGFENDEEENRKIVKMIKECRPDVLFVALGAPKQEKWINRYKNEYRVPISIGIGAAFDFIADVVKRAPVWMQKSGLEWFWRLMMEPKRLWRRYLVDDMKFLGLVAKAWLKERSRNRRYNIS